MRHRIYPFVILGALVASGCSGGGGTPRTATSPMPSTSASASASPTPSSTPTATPSPSGSPALTGTGLYVAVPYPNAITQVTTTLTVPPEPPATGAVIIWPGLVPCCSGSPTNPTFLPINSGTLQPELTWGQTYAPTTQPSAYSTWWISGQYNNFAGADTGYTGFQSGSAISVNPGDTLFESLTLNGTVWNEQITDETTSESTSFQIDMLGQTQNELYLYMQGNGQNPVGAVTFTNTSFTTASALSSASACTLSNAGTVVDDTQSAPTLSGTTCSIATITLLPAASPVPALHNRAPAAAVRFPQPSLPTHLRTN